MSDGYPKRANKANSIETSEVMNFTYYVTVQIYKPLQPSALLKRVANPVAWHQEPE